MIIVALTLLAVYLFDTVTPLGEPVWLLYFVPLILSLWSSRDYAVPIVCIVTIIFLTGGFFLSPPGVAVSIALVYRYVFALVFISVSAILWIIRRQQIFAEML